MAEEDREEVLKKIWSDDLLGRKADADWLQAFLVGEHTRRKKADVPGSFVLEIDADWGAGKTFFMDRFALQLEASGHLVARINAWKDDHLSDPFTSVMAAIDAALDPFTKKPKSGVAKAWRAVVNDSPGVLARIVVGAGKQMAKKYLGDEAAGILPETGDVVEAVAEGVVGEIDRVVDKTTEAAIALFRKQGAAASNFGDRLSTALGMIGKEKPLPMFVLVDELDRCRPPYAVALLERVKHLFDVPDLIFVFGTNGGQLARSVAGAYGPEFDGFRYLKRFFDRTYHFTEPDLSQFFQVHMAEIDFDKFLRPKHSELPQVFLTEFLTACRASLRDAKQIMRIIADVGTAWSPQFKEIRADLLTTAVLSVDFLFPAMARAVAKSAREPSAREFSAQIEQIGHPYVPHRFRYQFGISRMSVSVRQSANAVIRLATQYDRTEANMIQNENPVTEERIHSREVFLQEPLFLDGKFPSSQARLPEMVRSAGRFSGPLDDTAPS